MHERSISPLREWSIELMVRLCNEGGWGKRGFPRSYLIVEGGFAGEEKRLFNGRGSGDGRGRPRRMRSAGLAGR